MKNVNQGIRKKDAMALLTGKPVYMDDLAPRDCLIVKVLRSPHANAMIQSVKTDAAMKVPGIAAVYEIPHKTRKAILYDYEYKRYLCRSSQSEASVHWVDSNTGNANSGW